MQLLPQLLLAVEDTNLEDSQTSIFELSPLTVSVLVGTLLPLLVGLVTKASWSSRLKAVLLALLSAVSGLVVQATVENGGAVFTQEALIAAVVTFVIAVGAHVGFWKPTGATAKVQATGVHD